MLCMLKMLQRLIASNEYALRLARGRLYAERLVPSPHAEPGAASVNSQMAHLVSGGTRGLGLTYAQHLVHHGAKCVVVMGRQPALSKEELVKLACTGAAVFTVR